MIEPLVEVEDGSEVVTEAADWLDRTMPGWYSKVDPATLNMQNSQLCVGGQIGEHWWELTEQFMAENGVENDCVFATYDNEWRDAIRSRQG